MFYNCSKLESINLLKFDTSQVTYMGFMFSRCQLLKSLDLSSFNTFKVVDMSDLFYGCNSLISIDLSNFDMINCYSYDNMFSEIDNIRYINLYNIKNDKIISNTFNNVSNPIYVCQKDIIIDSPKVYNCCDSLGKVYECNSPNNIIPSEIDKTDSSNTKSSSSKSIWIYIGFAIGFVVLAIVVIIICCKFDCPLKRCVSQCQEKQPEPSSSSIKQAHDTTNSNIEINNDKGPTVDNKKINNDNEQKIFEYKPEIDKDNPIKVIFENPGFGNTNILIDSSESIDELINFYFKINGRTDLYGNKSIIFLKDGNCFPIPYPKEPVGTLVNKVVNSKTIKICVNDNDDKMKKIKI